MVGVVAENPARIVAELKLLPGQTGAIPAIATLTPADLPERIQAWAPLDSLVWQDTDSSSLTPAQLDCLRGWIAGGGRLVIVGGTAGADSLSGFPDDLLPYRPDGLLDIDPQVLQPILGGLPEAAAPLTAYAGALGSRPGPRRLRQSRDRRRTERGQRCGDAAGVRPGHLLARQRRRLGYPAVAPAPARPGGRAPSRSPMTRASCPRS